MPYEIRKRDGKYHVINKKTGKEKARRKAGRRPSPI